jgi:hypothetical protein
MAQPIVTTPKALAKGRISRLPDQSGKPISSASPPELRDEALSREEVENFLFEIKHQPNWRRESDRAADYYDGNQLDQDAVDKLTERGQPPLITNLIKPTIDTVLGLEAKSRTDWVVRQEDDASSEADLAEALSVKLKHAEIESRADRACSDAYAAQVKAGLGWVEVSRNTDPFDSDYRVTYVHRREIFWDWRAEKPDLSDARYLIRRRWLDLSHAIALMPQYAQLLRNTVAGWSGFDPLMEEPTGLVQSFYTERDTRLDVSDWRDNVRQRVCLNEIWYRKWVKGTVMRLPNGRVVECDLDNPAHCEAVLSGIVEVREAVYQRVRLAWYCGPHFLYDVPTPYRHSYFPYVPFFGFREDQTMVPYGLIRSMISPQDEINARKSKQLWLLNSRRVITDSDAVNDHEQAMREIARPDAYVILNPNRRPNSRFEVEDGTALAPAQGAAMMEAKNEIAEASGIHKAMMGQSSAATAGIAINSLIDQGLTTLAEINDNFHFARRLVGECLFSMLQEDLSKGPVPVKLGSGMSERVVVLNDLQQDPQSGQPVLVNDVARVRARIVLDDIKSTPTYRQQVMTQLTEITKSLPPEAQAALAPLWVQASDLPGKEQVIDTLRRALNLPDDSPQGRMAAQQQAAINAKKQEDQYALAMQEQQAKIEKLHADAAKLMADVRAIDRNIESVPHVPLLDHHNALNEVRQAGQDQIDALQEQIAKLQVQLANRQAEIAAKSDSDVVAGRVKIEQAKINAHAQLEAARMAADSAKEVALVHAKAKATAEKKKVE